MSTAFSSPKSTPGGGIVHLALLPPDTPRLKELKYQYPLKLVSPAPLWTHDEHDEPAHLIHTVYLLAYGGGVVAGDSVDLKITVEASTRLILLTQGSTKIFKAPSRELLSKQSLTVDLFPNAAICYLPDPVQPFEKSSFRQQQTYLVHAAKSPGIHNGSLCILDWVSNGRPANGENWSFHHYTSRNEIYLCQDDGRRRLVLRDSMILDERDASQGLAERMEGLAVYGTLFLYGNMFEGLGKFFMDEFKSTPRIGARKWDSGSDDGSEEMLDPHTIWRNERHRTEKIHRIFWSAASGRDCIVIKFGAPLLEHARRWLSSMLTQEKSIVNAFGERALLCLGG
jgi:urease accessory protein